LNDSSVDLYARELAVDIAEGVSDEEPFSANVFTRLVLERLEEAGHLDSAFDLHQEGRIGNALYRIDGFSFDEERASLELFATIYRGDVPPARIPSVDATRAIEKALRFANACVDGLADRLEPSNTDASDLARRIQAEASKYTTIRVVLLTDGILAGSLPAPADWKGRIVEYDVYDIVRLQRVLGAGETRSDISVDVVALTGSPLPCLHIPSDHGGYDAYLAALPGEALSQVYERYGVRLLELNVRAFLGVQGRKSVNAELRRTIVEQPSMFLAFNNGIVATADSIELTDESNGVRAIRVLHGLQIVNGGQTTASLHRARRKEHAKLDYVVVPIKIIRVGGADLTQMVASISRAANRQNTVQLADFSANDPFHQQVEALANNTWLDDGRGRWFYERARGTYVAAEQKASYRKAEQQSFRLQTPKHRRISKVDLARYLTAWASQPGKVCLGGQKNFQFFMQRMKDDPPPQPDATWFKRLVAIAILYRAVERTVRAMKFPAYGAQIVAYLVSAISHRTGGRVDFNRIWTQQAVTPAFESMMRSWAPIVDTALRDTAGQRNPSEWFKKEDCWKAIRESLPTICDPLPAELSQAEGSAPVAAQSTNLLSAADYDRIARCTAVPSAVWMEVAERGLRAGLFHWRVAGICRTLASYATGGWERKPSPKQARPALQAFDAVKDAGLLGAAESV
jgi:hypothetical protein